jgi:predicted nucleic acid-binding protein
MARGRPRPFIDTNVFFSGIYSPAGPPGILLEEHARGHLTMVISHQVLIELVNTVRQVKPDLLPQLRTFLTNAPPEIAPAPTAEEIQAARACINRVDAPILAAPKKCGADCVVTGNTRHFTPKVAECANVAIFTPREYVEKLRLLQ